MFTQNLLIFAMLLEFVVRNSFSAGALADSADSLLLECRECFFVVLFFFSWSCLLNLGLFGFKFNANVKVTRRMHDRGRQQWQQKLNEKNHTNERRVQTRNEHFSTASEVNKNI